MDSLAQCEGERANNLLLLRGNGAERGGQREDHKVTPLLPMLICGRSGQAGGLSGGDPPNPPCGRRGRTGAGEVYVVGGRPPARKTLRTRPPVLARTRAGAPASTPLRRASTPRLAPLFFAQSLCAQVHVLVLLAPLGAGLRYALSVLLNQRFMASSYNVR